ncbi:FRIGIDA-like protein 4b [Lathyrus oleraceus]|uniref:FRIGIDA-like protein 4b n=1 Tax=Pisum sativum TaxID=3888 RepID=UPI0021D26C5E|nr:FRIGIDA-like protein 4b [Pisum sativum]
MEKNEKVIAYVSKIQGLVHTMKNYCEVMTKKMMIEKVHQFFNELESHKNTLTKCTDLFTTLSNHFSTVQDSISQKLQTLDSKFQSLESRSKETLESLDNQENSIPERESSAAARIDEQKEAALADLCNSVPMSTLNISDALKSLSRKMDASALLRFMVSKRKESVMLRPEIVVAIKEAVDPPRLVLDAVEEYLKSKTEAKSGVTDKRWACGLLIQGLIAESSVYSRRIVERAAGLVDLWKEQLDGEHEKGAAEMVMFLQIVACFGLRSKFDDEYLRKSVMEFASRRDMAKVAASLEFGDKMIDEVVDEFVYAAEALNIPTAPTKPSIKQPPSLEPKSLSAYLYYSPKLEFE